MSEFLFGDGEPEPNAIGQPMPERAKHRIAENRRTRNKSLDLSNCGLTEVPTEVSELVLLETLILTSNERLTDLAPLAGLSCPGGA